jgi:hypothetical protein
MCAGPINPVPTTPTLIFDIAIFFKTVKFQFNYPGNVQNTNGAVKITGYCKYTKFFLRVLLMAGR